VPGTGALVHPERPRHAVERAERVDEHGDVAALGALEEQRGAVSLGDAVGDVTDLQVRVDLDRDALELAALLEQGDVLPQVLERHPVPFSPD
jgi:hypothetical protein